MCVCGSDGSKTWERELVEQPPTGRTFWCASIKFKIHIAFTAYVLLLLMAFYTRAQCFFAELRPCVLRMLSEKRNSALNWDELCDVHSMRSHRSTFCCFHREPQLLIICAHSPNAMPSTFCFHESRNRGCLHRRSCHTHTHTEERAPAHCLTLSRSVYPFLASDSQLPSSPDFPVRSANRRIIINSQFHLTFFFFFSFLLNNISISIFVASD